MKFKETLELAKVNKINALDLSIAVEVESVFPTHYKEKEEIYERLCSKVSECYLASDYSDIYQICLAMHDMIFETSIETVLNTSKWDILTRASY